MGLIEKEGKYLFGIEAKEGKIKGDVREIIVDMCYAKWLSGKPKPAPREFDNLEWFTLEEAKKLDKDRISAEISRIFVEI